MAASKTNPIPVSTEMLFWTGADRSSSFLDGARAKLLLFVFVFLQSTV
jgi:hypothetical protein